MSQAEGDRGRSPTKDPLHGRSMTGAQSPGQTVPDFMLMPSLAIRERMKRTFRLMVLAIVLSTPLWPRVLLYAVGVGLVLLAVYMLRWWNLVEFEVRESQKNNLYENAPAAGVYQKRLNTEQLMDSLVRRVSDVKLSGRRPVRVCLLKANSGGGHLAALNALKEVLSACNFDWELIDVDLPAALETNENNTLYTTFNVTGEEIYNWCLATNNFWSSTVARILSTLSNISIFMCHACPMGKFVGVDIAKNFWLETKPDLVVSVITMVNGIAGRGLHAAGMGHVPVAVLVTDFEESFVHPWMQDVTHYIIAGTKRIQEQCKAKNYPPNNVFPVSGMVMRPSFYNNKLVGDRQEELRTLGLDPTRRTCLLFYGGYASRKLPTLARMCQQQPVPLNYIFICGKNSELKQELDTLDFGDSAVHVVGYTRNVPHYMWISDFCVCKPGPAVITEAAWFGLPLLIEHNMATLAQEKCVATWSVEMKLAMLWRRESQLPQLVTQLLTAMGPVPDHQFRRIGHHLEPNYAIFQIPDILSEIVKRSQREAAQRERREREKIG